MKLKFLIIALALLATNKMAAQISYQASWPSLRQYQTPEWFKDAKFGIFIHWGVYSVPAFGDEWYPRYMYQKGSDAYNYHVKKYGPLDKFGYKDFIPMFKAEHFNAAEWVKLFKKAGAKYVVPVAEHHDGFAMYKTALSKWNAVAMGPKRDVIAELSKATREANLVFGLSSHRIEHWWFMNGGRRLSSDVNDRAFEDFYGPAREEDETMTPEFMNDWLLRCTELVDKYQPQLFWFDWWIEQPALEPYRKSFAAYYYNKGLEWNKGVVLNSKFEKAYPEGTSVLDVERGKLDKSRNLPWQTDDAISYRAWCYRAQDSLKSSKYLINNLVDIVSKNGNLLLNIGPRPDGTIPDDVQERLLAIGKWLETNGEAIYGTRTWKVFGEGPTLVTAGAHADQKDKPFTANDIRFTTKGDILYAIALDQPREKLLIKNLALAGNKKIKAIELLGSNKKPKWKQGEAGLSIEPMATYPSNYAVAYKITFESQLK